MNSSVRVEIIWTIIVFIFTMNTYMDKIRVKISSSLTYTHTHTQLFLNQEMSASVKIPTNVNTPGICIEKYADLNSTPSI